MITTQITIINKLGLHARASAKFVSTASKYQSQIEVTFNNKTINGKSIMGVMTLAASQGSLITLHIDGPDEDELTRAITTLIDQKFHEAE